MVLPLTAQGLFQFSGQSTLSGGLVQQPPRGLVIADITGDGKADAITGSAGTNRIDVAAGDGLGGFSAAATTIIPLPPGWPAGLVYHLPVAAVDCDSDGDLDVVALADYGAQVHLNVGGGVLQPGPVLSGSALGFGGAVDLNGDGLLEIVTGGWLTSYTATVIRIFSQLSGGQFALVFDSLNTSHVLSPGAIVCMDANGDGLKDVVFSDAQPGLTSVALEVLLTAPNLTFVHTGPFAIPLPPGCASCSVGVGPLFSDDLTGDGIEDLVCVGVTSPPVTRRAWIYPVGGGSLGTPTIQTLFTGSGNTLQTAPHVVDFDLDGVGELLYHQQPSGLPDLFRLAQGFTTGGTMISVPSEYIPGPFGSDPMFVTPGDLDDDGDFDLAFLHWTQAPAIGQPLVHTLRTWMNQTRYHSGCAPTSALALGVGTPGLGNATFHLSVSGAPPGSVVALGLSHGSGFAPLGPCLVSLDLTPGALILPSGSLGIINTDVSGGVQVNIPIPNVPALLGTDYFLQWIAVDATGPISLGGATYTLSGTRRIYLW